MGQRRSGVPDAPARRDTGRGPPPAHLARCTRQQHRITAHGRAIAALPLHPRLAHMLLTAGKQAAPLAALLAARDPLRGAPVDLALRIAALRGRYDGPGQINHAALAAIKAEIPRLSKGLRARPPMSLAAMAALAYPDRIGLRRKGDAPRYVLSGGKGAILDAAIRWQDSG